MSGIQARSFSRAALKLMPVTQVVANDGFSAHSRGAPGIACQPRVDSAPVKNARQLPSLERRLLLALREPRHHAAPARNKAGLARGSTATGARVDARASLRAEEADRMAARGRPRGRPARGGGPWTVK
jgi:hypothetical protein